MERRFFYHAFGVGLGGRITRPCCELIEAQAATALPSVGGYASSHVDGYRFRDIVSVRSARSFAVGSQAEDGSFNTSITVTVEGLNILGVITAESITARLASRHPKGIDEPVITAIGSEFRNLRIAGDLIDVQIDHDLFFQERNHASFKDAGARLVPKENWLESASKGMVMTSLVKRYSIPVPSVGTVFLGEILASGYARRLTMVRVAMGSPVAGDLEVASGEDNGSTYP